MSSNSEGRLSLALHAYSTGVCKSLRAAAALYDVSRVTLSRRHRGTLPRQGTRAATCKFTFTEEQILLKRILDLDSQGFPPQISIVRETANLILTNRGEPILQTVGQKWVRNFVNRHDTIRTMYNRKYDYQRAQCEDPERIQGWFRLVRNTIAKYGILDNDIYNFDETGFQMGVISTSKVVTRAETKGRTKTVQPGNREWVTVIHGINSQGWALPAFIIFAAKLHQATWYRTGLPSDWKISTSDNGWTNDQITFQWLQHFQEHTVRRTKGRYRLLVLDGHGSHHTAQFEELCRTNSIITLCMPPHSSHILQPLDVSCFGPLKRAYGRQVESRIRLGINHITKEEFLTAYFEAHQLAITPENSQTGFAATGLVPYDPDRVLSNLNPIVRTPSPVLSAASLWESKTPQNPAEIKRQAEYIRTTRRQRRGTSSSPSDLAFNQVLKGFETAVHDRAILLAENATLRAENQRQKRKRAQRRTTIRTRGSMSIQDGQDKVIQREVQEQIETEVRSYKTSYLASQPDSSRTRAPSRCSKCGSFEHTSRSCRIDL